MSNLNPARLDGESKLDVYLWIFNKTAIGLIRRLPFGRVSIFRFYTSVMEISRKFRLGYTFFGSRLFCDPVDSIQQRILYFGMWEPDISVTILSSLEAGDVFVDIGANIGYDSLLAASKVGVTGKVVAIEASPHIFAKLQVNVERNLQSNIRLVNAAVADDRGTVSVVAGPAENIGSTFIAYDQPTAGSQIRKYPLDEILKDDELRHARLIKMDIEGSELPVMRDILANISRFSSKLEIITEITPRNQRSEWEILFKTFLESGFLAYRIKNDYHTRHYIDWNGIPEIRQIYSLPNEEMIDVLFTRSKRQQI